MNKNALLVIGIVLIALYVFQQMSTKKTENITQTSGELSQTILVQQNESNVEQIAKPEQGPIVQTNSTAIENNQTEDQEPTYEPHISDPILVR